MALQLKFFLSFLSIALIPLLIVSFFVFQRIRSDSNVLFIILQFVVVSIFFTSLWASFTFSRPIVHLAELARAIGNKNFSKRVRIVSRDEIGTLGNAVNKMADQLEAAHVGLEETIKERTSTLMEEKAKDEAILASISDGVVMIDEKGGILFINPVAERMVGLRLKDVRGENYGSAFRIENEEGTMLPFEKQSLAQALTLQKSYTTSITEATYIVRSDTTRFPVSISTAPVILAGKIVGAVGVYRDITKDKQIDKAKTEFVSLASHQLRTPLSTISWYGEVLLSGDMGPLTPKQRKYLEEIYNSNQRMVALVGALLNVARLELGTLIVEPITTNIVGLIKTVLSELRATVIKKQFIVKEIYGKKIPLLSVDPKHMSIIFQNILSNAIKYSPSQGVIEINLDLRKKGSLLDEKKKASQDVLLFQVTDTGIGIPLAQQERIFKKLFRADNARAHDPDGTGLGLYIVKSIIDLFGGEIWFQSEEGKGTTFYVTIPLEGMVKKAGTRALT
ncbi:MAG: ATP-binding protein [bacterium]|nr:ATP-binding protein [bacterium]